MKTYPECVPCLLRQALEGARHATDDEAVVEEVLRSAGRMVANVDLEAPTPLHIGEIHRNIRRLTGDPDPYRAAKDRFNRTVLNLYPDLKELIGRSPNPLETALLLAVGGNEIDMIVDAGLEKADIGESVKAFLSIPLHGSLIDEFKSSVRSAQEILYLGDNAGEIVLDRLLMEELPTEKITYVVKGNPVINDVTMEDARACGLTELVEVIDNGTDLPGTVLDQCADAFRERFFRADLVISKGQGNYESLSDVNRNLFFLFKAKCQVITLHLGYEVGSPVMIHTRGGDRPGNHSATYAQPNSGT
ncbi:MAG: ARMT1-like domain-containing protein [Desulfomonilaceae bacterium]|nr:ARMT1-like domain-containing protein [Desulfomonilaceae bacterium]